MRAARAQASTSGKLRELGELVEVARLEACLGERGAELVIVQPGRRRRLRLAAALVGGFHRDQCRLEQFLAAGVELGDIPDARHRELATHREVAGLQVADQGEAGGDAGQRFLVASGEQRRHDDARCAGGRRGR